MALDGDQRVSFCKCTFKSNGSAYGTTSRSGSASIFAKVKRSTSRHGSAQRSIVFQAAAGTAKLRAKAMTPATPTAQPHCTCFASGTACVKSLSFTASAACAIAACTSRSLRDASSCRDNSTMPSNWSPSRGNVRFNNRAASSNCRCRHTQRCHFSGNPSPNVIAPAISNVARSHTGVSITRSSANTSRYDSASPNPAASNPSINFTVQTR